MTRQHLVGPNSVRRQFQRVVAGLVAIGALAALSGCGSFREARNQPVYTQQDRLPFFGPPRPAGAGEESADGETPHVVSYDEPRDPLIYLNRATHAFNDVLYRFLLIPVAKGYLWIAPRPVERSVGNFFYNVKTPIYAVNHLLQLKPKRTGQNLLRFGINSTLGVLGLFDPAKAWFGMERAETHLDDTLAGYGMGYGIYLVIPVLGPSDVRNGLSSIGDYFLNPIPYVTENPYTTGITSFDYLQDFAPQADRYTVIRNEAKDRYKFFRNLYLQAVQRDADYR